jgi:hypothetical protein
MAFTEFYMQTTGSNLNAGSTNADAASVTSTNGSWDITAETFIATGGTPFAAVNVGDWVSIYNDAATVTPFVAQVTAIYLSGLGVTVSTTVKFGTKPAAGATGKSCKVGGAWADLGMLASGVALNTGTTAVAMRLNLKAGTYASTTTSRTWALAGTATLPIWIRGYASAIGDLDTDFSTAPPLVTWTTGQFTVSAGHTVISNISITSQATASSGAVIVSGGAWLDRVRIENTAANSASRSLTFTGGVFNRLTRCWFKATTTADAVVHINNSPSSWVIMQSCYMTGGIACFKSVCTVITNMTLANCHFISPATYGIHFTSVADDYQFCLLGGTVYGPSSDGIRLDILSASGGSLIANTIFSNCGGYGINNNSGANASQIARVANDFYSCSSGNETGFGDHPNFAYPGTESSSPFTNAGGGDFSLVTGALAIAGGSPGQFENTSLIGYMDCGAMQKQATGGAGTTYGHIIGGN